LVAGNICNTWVYDPEDAEGSGQIVRGMYDEQVRWAKEAGADFIIAETISFLGEALIALEVIHKYGLPAVITFAILDNEKSQDGFEWVEGKSLDVVSVLILLISACQILEKKGAEVVGFNCFRGPQTMLPLLRKLRPAVKCHIAAQPGKYLILMPGFVISCSCVIFV
jgi:betaine-homocysteine S-methyltransferase